MDLRQRMKAADPLAFEAAPSALEIAQQRQAVVEAVRRRAPATPSARRLRRRLTAPLLLLLAVAATAWLVSWSTTPVRAAVRLEVRLAEERPAPGLREARVEGTGRTIYLHGETIVTNEDVTGAGIEPSGPGFSVHIRFSSGGGARLQQATATHLGRPLAVLIDNVVVMAPVVRSAIDGAAMVTGTYARAEAERLAAGLTER